MQIQTPIIISSGGLSLLSEYINQLNTKYTQSIIISTPQVFQLYGKKVQMQLEKLSIDTTHILISEGESAKTLQQAETCWTQMSSQKLDRYSLVIALGGGAVTDLGGFVASCYMRGIDSIYIPTTLMGMVDASIGGKTAINLFDYKNFIGTFHFPRLVIIDPTSLQTLAKRELISGLAEVIKYGMIKSSQLFQCLEDKLESILALDLPLIEKIIQQCCEIKQEIIKTDPYDRGIRAILNYGHTFGHAIEALTNYEKYLHGETVSIGMSCAASLSIYLNKIDLIVKERQDRLCTKAGLPIHLPTNMSIDSLIEQMRSDKKAKQGKISLILPKKIGEVEQVFHLDEDLIRQLT